MATKPKKKSKKKSPARQTVSSASKLLKGRGTKLKERMRKAGA